MRRCQTPPASDYEGKPERQMCRLHLSMTDEMNVRLPKSRAATRGLEEV